MFSTFQEKLVDYVMSPSQLRNCERFAKRVGCNSSKFHRDWMTDIALTDTRVAWMSVGRVDQVDTDVMSPMEFRARLKHAACRREDLAVLYEEPVAEYVHEGREHRTHAPATPPAGERDLVYFRRPIDAREDCVTVPRGTATAHVRAEIITRVVPAPARPTPYTYVLNAGRVTSPRDGDSHFISAAQLASLYNVPISRCVIAPSGADAFTWREPENAWNLWPRPDGRYKRPPDAPPAIKSGYSDFPSTGLFEPYSGEQSK